MAGVPIHKYFVVLLLLIGLACTHADNIEKSEIDKETLTARSRLFDSMFEDELNLTKYAFERGNEICHKLHDEQVHKNETSEELDNREMLLAACAICVVNRLDPIASRRGDHPDEIPWRKYGFEDIRKVMDQKYEEFYVKIVRQIDEYVKGLTAEEHSRMTAENLKMWSSEIKNASTLAAKDMAFRKYMRFNYFERGV
ncbi:uncharacterized protein LOC128919705 isoform X1 [Zeugodacus cucurbitae]|uniref:uncharacterized protein LOC128919705 isoform X1 n=1 Tax=Zeugodacus cucurbitae TaxID=28588 RepID=UPI0023D8FE78|nr:uncharacterized protein LOC128919705 isoform X1 [Zeugodacus cucurbitae]